MNVDWGRLILSSLTRPRQAGAVVLGLPLGQQAWMIVLLLLAVVSAVFVSLPGAGEPSQLGPAYDFLLRTPVLLAVIQAIGGLILALLVFWVGGHVFDGRGDFRGSLAVTVWHTGVGLLLQAAILVLSIIVPPIAGLATFFFFFWTFWALSAFVGVLHGFQNNWLVFGVILGTGFVLTFAIVIIGAMIALMLGIEPPQGV